MSEVSATSSRKTSKASRSATSSRASAGGRRLFDWPDGPTLVQSGPGVVPVSRSLQQASEGGPPTAAIYGPTFADSSRSASLQQSLENRLRARTEGTGSPLYVLTWKRWAMRSGAPICALRASVRRKSDSDSGGWQTPTTRDGKGQSGKGNRIKRGKNGRLHVANLCDQLVDIGRPDLVRSTQFRCWLMGYPESWEHARAMAMPSSLKSRPSSSKPQKKPAVK